MKCPYCNQEMKLGNMSPLYPRASKEMYWLPEDSKPKWFFLSNKKSLEAITNCGGLIFGEPGIFSEDDPRTYHCKDCKMLITKLDN